MHFVFFKYFGFKYKQIEVINYKYKNMEIYT